MCGATWLAEKGKLLLSPMHVALRAGTVGELKKGVHLRLPRDQTFVDLR